MQLDQLAFLRQPALCPLPGRERDAGAVELAIRAGVADLVPAPGLYDCPEAPVVLLGLVTPWREPPGKFPAGNSWGTFGVPDGAFCPLRHLARVAPNSCITPSQRPISPPCQLLRMVVPQGPFADSSPVRPTIRECAPTRGNAVSPGENDAHLVSSSYPKVTPPGT